MEVWTESRWQAEEQRLRARVLAAESEPEQRRLIHRSSRAIMRAYTTSFFMVSRFLPPGKRADVEVIYASVRYPDEVADTFSLEAADRFARLDRWAGAYETGLRASALRDAVEQGASPWIAAFAGLVRRAGMPAELYRSFLAAMRLDVEPRLFRDLRDLVESYVYGSAIVVGAFLTYVYGSRTAEEFDRAMQASRDLGIGLQLTNFLRDVTEDERRGRLYLPLDWLAEEGLAAPNPLDPKQEAAFVRVIRRMADEAETRYRAAEDGLDAFSPDCRIAIRACLDVYRLLNDRIRRSERGIRHRESVPLREKWALLPASKYWRIPLAYGMPFI